jgi:transcriptional regulator with XRE-family HTH domain
MTSSKWTIVDLPSAGAPTDTRDVAQVVDRLFGDFVRGLRHARGLTQEALAKRGGMSADTVRRLEAGAFSPSLQTLRKLAAGLDLNLGTIFTAFELRDVQRDQEIVDLLATRSPYDLDRALRVLVVFFDAIDERTDEPVDDHQEARNSEQQGEPSDDEPADGEPE